MLDFDIFSIFLYRRNGGYFFAPALRIAGGTDEVMRNIIAERVLGLPQDERADKKVPFNEIPSGKN